MPIKGTILTVSFVVVFLTAFCLVDVKPVGATSATENTWSTKAPMPITLSNPKAAALNGKIYVIGAHLGENKNNSLYEYNPATNAWAIKKSMLSSRIYFAVTACENKIYVIGGGLNPQQSHYAEALSNNEAYDPATNTWETKAPMPTARTQMEANTVDGKIYVISGRTAGSDSTVTTSEVYDPDTDSWAKKTAIPYPVASYASAVVDSKIYIIGGQDEYYTPMNPGFNQIYDTKTDTWMQGAKEPNPAWVSESAAATTGVLAPKMIYVMGGVPGFAPPLDQNNAYNPINDSWRVAASLPSNRSSFAIAVVEDSLYIIGGTTIHFGELTASVEQYIPIGYKTPDPSYEPSEASEIPESPSPSPMSTPKLSNKEPFPSSLVAAAFVASAIVACVSILLYLRKQKLEKASL